MNALQTTVLESDAAQVITSPAVDDKGIRDAWLTPTRFSFFLALLVFATFSSVLLGRATFVFRDFGLFSYPVAFFQRQCFWRGELPLWNPYNYCGVPFLAQWNTMTLYPPSLIYLLLPLTWSLPFFCLVHLFWGGLGMYFLAHRWTSHRLGASLAGVIFSFNGLSLNFLMWPSHIATFSWVPWVLWLVPEGWHFGGRKLLLGVLVASLQMLAGGPETILFTWVILGLLAVGECIVGDDVRSLGGTDPAERGEGVMEWWSDEKTNTPILQRSVLLFGNSSRRLLQWFRIMARLVGIGLLVALICSAQLLPFLELLAHSQRDSNYGGAAHNWSMPFWGLANFLVPLFRTTPTAQGVFLQTGQYWTSSYYAGIGLVWLAATAVWQVRTWRVRLLALVCFLGLILSLGDLSLLFGGVRACFPSLGLMRYPVKFVTLVLVLSPILGALGLATLERKGRHAIPSGLAFLGVLLLLLGTIIGLELKSPTDLSHVVCQNAVSRAGFLVLEVLLVTFFWRAARPGSSALRRRPLLGCAVLVLFWLDLITHTPNQNPTVSPETYSPWWVEKQLQRNPAPELGQCRAMVSRTARETLRQNWLPNAAQNHLRNRLAAWADLNLLDDLPEVDGFFSLAPREIWQVTELFYSQLAQEHPGLLDFLAAAETTAPGKLCDWVARRSALPFVTTGQSPMFAEQSGAFDLLARTNLDFSQVVILPSTARTAISATSQSQARVGSVRFANQKVSFETDSPDKCLVVISQTYYPGWKAYIDGRPQRLWRANYAFQALEAPAGKHQVVLIYTDHLLLLGLVLSATGSLVCAVWWKVGGTAVHPAQFS